MNLSVAPLLIHEEDVPAAARAAVKAAYEAPLGERDRMLESAARVVYRETDLDCDDVRDLFGLEGPRERGDCDEER